VFRIYKGHGECFDLSTKPITRERFSLGQSTLQTSGYLITDRCRECEKCTPLCPQDYITKGSPYVIKQNHCLHCGNCYNICPHKEAIINHKILICNININKSRPSNLSRLFCFFAY